MTQTTIDIRTRDFLLQYFPDLRDKEGPAGVISGFYPAQDQGWVMVFLGNGSIRTLFIDGPEASDPERASRNRAWHFLQNGDPGCRLAAYFVDAFRRYADAAWTENSGAGEVRASWAVLAHVSNLDELRKCILLSNKAARKKFAEFPRWLVDTAHRAHTEAIQREEKDDGQKSTPD
jgi:hypothetical protein